MAPWLSKLALVTTASAVAAPASKLLPRPTSEPRLGHKDGLDADFLSWLSRGVVASVASREAAVASLAINDTGLGPELVAGRAFRSAEILVQLPGEFTVSGRMRPHLDAKPRQLWLQTLLGNTYEDQSEAQMAAVLALELQRQGDAGTGAAFRSPMLRRLPATIPEDFRWLRHPSAAPLLGLRRQLYSADRSAAKAAAVTPGTSASTAKLAFALATSRAALCAGGPVLLPTVQLMSHGGAGLASGRNVEIDKETCAHRALRRIAPGEPLRMSYGERPCVSWLSQYGFLPDDAAEDSETVLLELPMLLRDLGDLAAATRHATAGPTGENASVSGGTAKRVLRVLQEENAKWECSSAMVLPHRRLGELLTVGVKDAVIAEQTRSLQACFRVAFLARHWREFAHHETEATLTEMLEALDAGEPFETSQADAFAKRKGGEALRAKSRELMRLSTAAPPAGAPPAWWSGVQQCARRQSSLLNVWATWVTTAVVPPMDTAEEGFPIFKISLAVAATVTSLSMMVVGYLKDG